jgi:ABC-type multidrug transport system fused ATPase/permease subunit
MVSEFYFDIKQTNIYKALKMNKHPLFRLAGSLRKLFFILSIVCLLASVILTFYFIFAGSFLEAVPIETEGLSSIKTFEAYFIDSIKLFSLPLILSDPITSLLFGLFIIFLCFGMFAFAMQKFFDYIKNPATKVPLTGIVKIRKRDMYEKHKKEEIYIVGKHNLAEYLDFDATRTVSVAIRFARKNKIPMDSSVLFYFLIKKNPKLNFIFNKALLPAKEIEKMLDIKLRHARAHFRETPNSADYFIDFQDVILRSLIIGFQKKHKRAGIGDMLCALSEHNQIFKKILTKNKLTPQDISNLCDWLKRIEERIEKDKRFWDAENRPVFHKLEQTYETRAL